jgi:8-oxo-dGTP diphosphatase
VSKKVEAAGGVVWRRRKGTVEVALIHRPRYGDWSLPKGKLEHGEDHLSAAVREVAEETGFSVEVGDELASCRYVDNRGRDKRVRYWSMAYVDGEFERNSEVDKVSWLSVADATKRLTYRHDRTVLDSFTTPH